MSKKMNHGIKVSERGFDVLNLDKQWSKKPPSGKVLPNLLSSLALPYLFGAKKQVSRYKRAALLKPPLGSIECMHEASNLFEDLNTVAVYMKKSGKDHKDHQLWKDVRNHIRHAVREDFDEEDKSINKKVAQRLGLNPKLQINVGFDVEAIKVGATIVEMVQISKYLSWAEAAIADIIAKADEEGFIKGVKVIKKSSQS